MNWQQLYKHRGAFCASDSPFDTCDVDDATQALGAALASDAFAAPAVAARHHIPLPSLGLDLPVCPAPRRAWKRAHSHGAKLSRAYARDFGPDMEG